MIYLSGHVRAEFLSAWDLGVMLTPNMGNRPDLSRARWAADNGCYSQGDKFQPVKYMQWLESKWARDAQSRCLFATAPDVVGDAAATWERSKPHMLGIRRAGYKVALVAQDGLELMPVPWDEFDVLFVGGTDAWKFSEPSWHLMHEADARGKWVHVGRVNSWRRLKMCAVGGIDSADGTYVVFGPDKNVRHVIGWMQTLRTQAMNEHIAGCSL